MVSRKDVAERAGVSAASVSYYINKSGYVSESTGKRIQKAIDELGYVPNQIASSLRSRKSHNLIFLCTEIRNPFFTNLIYSATMEAVKKDYVILFSHTVDNENYIKKLLSYHAAGFFASNALLSKKLVDELLMRGIPVVVMQTLEEHLEEKVTHVVIDYSTIFREIKEHLNSQGYRKVLYVSASTNGTLNRRSRKFLETFGSEGSINFFGSALYDNPAIVLEGYTKNDMPDAFLCTTDAVAAGVEKVLKEKGIRVPEDCAVIGFDNTNYSMFASPAITSFGINGMEIGKEVMNLLLRKIEGEEMKDLMIKPELVIRQSSVRSCPSS